MGILGKLGKAGMAKKAFDVAKKPENQQKAKGMLGKLSGKNKGQQ